MKITIIHGQSHKGTSYHIGRALVNRLENEENITEFFLPRDMPHFCCGCYSCLKGEEFCPHYDSMMPIIKSLSESDLLVFTTPVYCLRTTGSMKALLDHLFVQWISHRPKKEMYYKKAVVIAVGSGAGMKGAAADIKTSLAYWGISEIWTYKQRSLATSWEGVRDETKDKIKQDMAKLSQKIQRRNGKHRISLKSKFMFFVMRMMQLKGWGACVEDRAYWEQRAWLQDKRPWKNSKKSVQTHI